MMNEEEHARVLESVAARMQGGTVVVKFGGAAISDGDGVDAFARDIAALARAGVHMIVVHGGGADVTEMADRLGITTEFSEGQRVTDADTLDVAVMVLAGRINKDLARRITAAGSGAVGLCGIDNRLLSVQRRFGNPDLGLVGDVQEVNAPFLRTLLSMRLVPVLAPIGMNPDGDAYNINADGVAGAVAAAMGAHTLLLLSNVQGVASGGVVHTLMDRDEVARLVADGTINGGMIPKVNSALTALDAGARSVRIVDGRPAHAVLAALADASLGTAIVERAAAEHPGTAGAGA